MRALGAAIAVGTLAVLTMACTRLAMPSRVTYTSRRTLESVGQGSQLVTTNVPRIDHVVVVAIDGVRWREVFYGSDPKLSLAGVGANGSLRLTGGVTPQIHRIAQTRGILLGSDESRVFVSSPSTLSLPGYSELFSGRTPKCGNNDCGSTDEPTLLDDWHSADQNASMAIASSWSAIPRVAARDGAHLFVSAGRAQPQNLEQLMTDPELRATVERGRQASPAPGTDDYRPDRYTAETAMKLLETLRPGFLFLGLGDTDEHAHHGNYDAYLAALHYGDSVVGRIDAWLSAQQQIGKHTLLIVTTDHGRAATFRDHGNTQEAARIWVLWSGDPVLGRGYPPAIDSRLADLAPTVRPLLGLKSDWDPHAGCDQRALIGRPPKPLDATRFGAVAKKS